MTTHELAIIVGALLIAIGVQGLVLRSILGDILKRYTTDILEPALRQTIIIQEDTRNIIADQREQRKHSLETLKSKYQIETPVAVTMNRQNPDGSIPIHVDNPMQPRGLRKPLDTAQLDDIEKKLRSTY